MKLKEWFGKREDVTTLRKRKLKWEALSAKAKAWVFIVLIFGEIILLVAFARMYGLLGEALPSGKKIAVIDCNEPITPEYTKRIISEMGKIKENGQYKALLFIMNSPGGSPSAADELAAYLRDFNATKPTYMYIQHIGTSGGYYIASAIKPLMANQNAIVGSIGVILPHFALEKLAQTIGVEEDDITVGKYKKPISLIKRLTREQREYLKRQMLLPTYQNFLKSVAQYRGLDVESLKPYAEGKIFIASAPEIQGILIDRITHLHLIKEELKKRFGKEVKFVELNANRVPSLFNKEIKFDIKVENPLQDLSLGGLQ